MKKSSVWVVLAVALSLLVASCSPSTPPTPTPEPKGGGGEFRAVMVAEPISLNPDLRSDDAAFGVAQSVYNKLVTLDADYRVIPDLAQRWEVSADNLTYTFHLAKNVKWHDGQPFSSADVKFTLETIAHDKGFLQDMATRITAIETPDANTVILRLKEPLASFVPTLAWVGAFILPKHVYEGSDWTKNPANEKPVGTGPFKVVEWVKGEYIKATANKEYFKLGPYLDTVIWRVPKAGGPTGPEMVVKGDADYSQAGPPREQVAGLQKQPGVLIKTYASTNRYHLVFNFKRKPFDDLRARKAVVMTIDTSAVLSKAFAGLGTPALGMYTPGIPWAYNAKARAPAYDLAAAQTLLDEAGLKRGADGIRFKAELVFINATPFNSIAPIVREQLGAAGIDVKLAPMATLADSDKRLYQDRDFDLWINNGSFGPDPENLYSRFGSNQRQAAMDYNSTEFDAAMAEGGKVAKVEERAKAYFRAQEILARDLPYVPLVDAATIVMSRDTVSGLGYNEARGLVTFQDYSLVRIKHP